jgi:hypothetical protein
MHSGYVEMQSVYNFVLLDVAQNFQHASNVVPYSRPKKVDSRRLKSRGSQPRLSDSTYTSFFKHLTPPPPLVHLSSLSFPTNYLFIRRTLHLGICYCPIVIEDAETPSCEWKQEEIYILIDRTHHATPGP